MAGELTLGDLRVAVKADIDALRKDLIGQAPRVGAQAGDAMGKSMSSRIRSQLSASNLGKGLAQGLGLGAGLGAVTAITAGVGAVTDAIGGAFNAAVKFEDQLATINTIARLSDDALADLGGEIQSLAVEAGKSTTDLTQGFYDLVSAGIASDDAMGVLHDAAILSTGALSTTSEAVDLLTTAINAFGLEASDSTRLIDIFAQSVEEGKVTAAEIASTLATVAPIAHEAGVSVEEVAAAYAVMTANGVPAEEVTQNLRQAIVALISPNTALNRIQERTGINFAELMKAEGVGAAFDALREATHGNNQELTDALGRVQALQVVLLTSGENADEFADSTDRMRTAGEKGGVALGQMGERADTAAGKQRRFNAAVEVLNQRVGEFMLGPGGDFLEWLANMATSTPAVEGRLGELYDALGLVERAVAEAQEGDWGRQKDPLGEIDVFPHETELRGFVDQWAGLGETLGITRLELRKMAEDTKEAAIAAGDLRPTADVLQELGINLLAISTSQEKVNAGLTEFAKIGTTTTALWEQTHQAVEGTDAALDDAASAMEEIDRRASSRELADLFTDAEGDAERLAEALDLVANTSLGEVRDSAKEAGKAIREAFRQPIPTVRALQREEQRLAVQRARAMKAGRFDIVAMIDARAEEVRAGIRAQRQTNAHYREERRQTNQRKQGLNEIQRALGVTRKEAARVYDAYNGDTQKAIDLSRELDGIDPAIAISTPGAQAALAMLERLHQLAAIKEQGQIPVAPVSGGGGGRRPKGRRRTGQYGLETYPGDELVGVGESEPEIFAPRLSGRVWNSAQIGRAAAVALGTAGGAGSKGTDITAHIYGLPMTAPTPVDVVHQLRRAARAGILAPPRPGRWAQEGAIE